MNNKRKFINFFTRALLVVWTLLLAAILFIIIERIYSYAEYIATQNAQTSVNKDLAYRTWVSSHGGVYVPIDKNTPPNPYLSNIKTRDFQAIGKEFTLMNPAYTLSQMMKQYSNLYGVKTHITSTRTLNPKNRPDTWETLALNKIEQTRESYKELNYIGDKEYLRFIQPLITKKSCLKCHATLGYQIGDVRGAVSVSIPMEPLYDDAQENSLYIIGLFFIIWLVGVFFISQFSRKINTYIDEKELLYEEYIYGLVNVVEKRDSYTAGHSSRVAKYAVKIAETMGYSEHDCHTLHRAGMLHDIGKVAIPDSVFLKPSKLSEDEYKLIQEHVDMSYEMLKNISIFDDIKEIVKNHHEHYDGSGYPQGLIGEETPMLAQILSLADAFDAMTTDRIYKGRKSVKEALLELAEFSQKQFNPKIVQAALLSLNGVIIDHTKHQNPRTLLEKERFSYFYKDALTGIYNEEYLRIDLENIVSSPLIGWLSLKDFHKFNKENGWSAGDKVFQELALLIKERCLNPLNIYRFYGDNFFVLLQSEEEFARLKRYLDEYLKSKNIEYEFKVSHTADFKDKIESFEDVLEKLF
jgi:putative nucleotidyltransferase with HDIG domain